MTRTDVTEQLVDDLKVVLERAEDLLETTGGGSGKKLEAARERLTNAISTLRAAESELQKKAVAALESSGRFVKEHPYETAGGGLALILALLGSYLWYQKVH